MNLQTVKQRFGIIGNSATLHHALQTAVQVAPTDLTVLITGSSGVGKESFSKIIHSLSARKHSKFIAINCGAIPEGTINSELFGHTKGAFTGATGERKGYFETVNGGTIFLDEIGEMPLDTQTYLLRVLEQGEFVKVGSSAMEKTDVRIVAATNVNLLQKVKQGKFREDLYYRLSTVPIKVPALRERPEDIPILFRKFAGDFAERYKTTSVRLSSDAQQLLVRYTWPGNIRELKNITEQVSVLSQDKLVSAEELLKFIPDMAQNNLPMLAGGNSTGDSSNGGFYEREILFKFLYDMKKDLNDMKALIAELARTNDLRMPTNVTVPSEGSNLPTIFTPSTYEQPSFEQEYAPTPSINQNNHTSSPIIINSNSSTDSNDGDKYSDVEEIEESLSIEDMEQQLIRKALDKHRGRRKEAAKELGISERTLYRKIKQYKIGI
ncbi:MAG: sigma-54-dependent Fis family transcriptional regulator [Aureispira sp.]|nr:sigma-54-dependent Fis family transcriptional regulator [Aureispira sp.]